MNRKKSIEIAINEILKFQENDDYSLFNGKAGILYSLLYANRVLENEELKKSVSETILELIKDLLWGLENVPMNASLGSGVTGIAYSLRVAKNFGFDSIIQEDWFEELDKIISISVNHNLKRKEFDLFRGATGMIIYFLNCSNKTQEIINYVTSLKKNAIWEENKCYWIFYSYNEKLKKLEYRTDVINLGLAHGLSSIVASLTEIYKKGICKEDCYQLIEGAINFLSSVRLNDKIQFTGIYYKSKKYQNSNKLGWCYGDSSVALAITKAGHICNEEKWTELGKNIGLNSAINRDISNSGLDDHGFCHGYFGCMHIYNRLYECINLEEYAARKKYWYEMGMAKRDFSINELGFFQTKFIPGEKKISKYSSRELLLGLPGVILSLISYEDTNLKWDKIFMTNIE